MSNEETTQDLPEDVNDQDSGVSATPVADAPDPAPQPATLVAETVSTPSGSLKYTLKLNLDGEIRYSGVYPTEEKAQEAEKSVYDRVLKWYGDENVRWTLQIIPVQHYMKLREMVPNPS